MVLFPIATYSTFLKASGETMDEVLKETNIVKIWFQKFNRNILHLIILSNMVYLG